MNIQDSLLALRYAKAFLNTEQGASLSQQDFNAICRGGDFFKKNKQVMFLLRLSMVDQGTKEKVLKAIIKEMGLSEKFLALLRLIIEHKRSFLFAEIFNQLCKEYKKRNGIHFFSVSSSIELSDKQKEAVHKNLERAVGGSIFCSYTVHSSLIAGIRVQSSNLLWEYSIRRKLWRIHNALLRR